MKISKLIKILDEDMKLLGDCEIEEFDECILDGENLEIQYIQTPAKTIKIQHLQETKMPKPANPIKMIYPRSKNRAMTKAELERGEVNSKKQKAIRKAGNEAAGFGTPSEKITQEQCEHIISVLGKNGARSKNVMLLGKYKLNLLKDNPQLTKQAESLLAKLNVKRGEIR